MALVFRPFRTLRSFVKSVRHYTNQGATIGNPGGYAAVLASQAAASSHDQGQDRSISRDSVLINGSEFHFAKTGTGKHPVLLLPGALGSGANDFKPQLENLNKDLFTLVAWDPAGYGGSQRAARDWSGHFLERDAHDAAQLMQSLHYEHYSLLGWSDGGITALIMAAEYPQRVHKAVVWGANAYLTQEEVGLYGQMRDVSSWSERMRAPFIKMYGREKFQALWEEWIDAFSRFYSDNAGDICRGSLGRVECPLLVIHGQKDALVPQFHADYIAQNVKGARLHNFADGKHNLHLKYFREVNSLVESFLVEPKARL